MRNPLLRIPKTMTWLRLTVMVASLSAGLSGTACKDLTGDLELPAGTSDPGMAKNAKGAREMATAARAQFQFAIAEFLPISGLLSDEFEANLRGPTPNNGAFPTPTVAVDSRFTPANKGELGSDATYGTLQQARVIAAYSIQALLAYDKDSSVKNRAELYALQGFSEIMLADLFCSGIPLSTLDFEQDFTYKAGSSTEDVYKHAAALFDTALMLAGDSSVLINLSKVGKGRALLAIGEYAQAGQIVQGVPLDFEYVLPIKMCGRLDSSCPSVKTQAIVNLAPLASVSDREGMVGYPFRSNNDPRTGTTNPGSTPPPESWPVYFPSKYGYNAASNVVVASGIEAELIKAEAALQNNADPQWLTILNTLRAQQAPAAGVLGPIVDPGTFASRVDSLFAERAAWLFATGHRQGDLRRLVLQYRRSKESVYPNGVYPGLGRYGENIDVPVPMQGSYSEAANPLYKGCSSRD